jgi:hypothetical protein
MGLLSHMAEGHMNKVIKVLIITVALDNLEDTLVTALIIMIGQVIILEVHHLAHLMFSPNILLLTGFMCLNLIRFFHLLEVPDYCSLD